MRADRHGERVFAGKRAMLVVTTGGGADLLLTIQHAILFYPGFSMLESCVVDRAGKMDAARFRA